MTIFKAGDIVKKKRNGALYRVLDPDAESMLLPMNYDRTTGTLLLVTSIRSDITFWTNSEMYEQASALEKALYGE